MKANHPPTKKNISRQTKAEIIYYQQTYTKRYIKKNVQRNKRLNM